MTEPAERIVQALRPLLREKGRLIVAIDGRCAAGKTTLAAELQNAFACNVLHMDQFFLRPWQRTAERLAIPGENVEHERFLAEALLPAKSGAAYSYRPFDCKTGELLAPVPMEPGVLTLVEGSYSCHPSLWPYYDYRVFLTVDPEEQLRRIRARNGERCAVHFQEKWIPLEEAYFAAYGIPKRCDARYDTGTALPQ